MTSYRIKGLVNLHIFATAGIATIYFLALAMAVPYLPILDLNPYVNVLLYSFAVLVGMISSARFWGKVSSRFHIIERRDAGTMASWQVGVTALFIFTLMVATKDAVVSRLYLAFFLSTLWVLLLIVNRFLPGYLAGLVFSEAHRIPTLFVGPLAAVGRLRSWMDQQQHVGIRIIGHLTDDDTAGADLQPRLGSTGELARVIEERNVGQVVLLKLPDDPVATTKVLEICQAAGCRLLIYQAFWDRLPVPMAPVLENEHLFLTLHDEPLEDPINRGLKRMFDVVVSLPVVVFLLPLLSAVVWLMQRLQSPGPLFFKRSRGGQRRREFVMLKYRSMHAADRNDNLEAQQATVGDKRIYPFGAFLRRTSLDEFPQFWNVLVGDMSIVGPRPHLPKHDTEFSLVAKTYRTRQLVKPGITGLAQVSGFRGEIADAAMLHRRVQLDIEYITQWSVWLDVEITIKTLGHVLNPPRTAV